MESILTNAFDAFNKYSGWIVWNLFLAFIPLALSFWLFIRSSKRRSPLWWLGLLVFIAFLPNAAYLLTDIIHLIEAIRAGYSIWITTLIFIPLHLFAILIGWEAYVISLINQSYYLEQQGAKKFVFTGEILVHALCAVGIYLGRFLRFNSWDFVTQPHVILTSTVNDLTAKKPLLVILITFFVLTVFYGLMKQITLGVFWRIRSGK
ncbi:DUF1361 domain-containing protein [Waterburya agarophytonicola K14]|uniref:DUF1361 domain-containing protein n=1 Tax=Waterburya agarophytonicola KI4 TaxID=2874699 RepID=A0A964BV54_9CYAN|nr:DUF1361 domain-containing protein [Waterburya agarophytonicola]MCC0179331.1 DUF1361 domain-containing protein [Waterburya agarophytonicola KI4]